MPPRKKQLKVLSASSLLEVSRYSAAKNSGVSRSLRQPSSSRRVSMRFLWVLSCHMVPGKLSASRMILAVRRGRYGNSSATASA